MSSQQMGQHETIKHGPKAHRTLWLQIACLRFLLAKHNTNRTHLSSGQLQQTQVSVRTKFVYPFAPRQKKLGRFIRRQLLYRAMVPPPALERQQLVAKQDRSPPRFSSAFLSHKNDLHAATLDPTGFNE